MSGLSLVISASSCRADRIEPPPREVPYLGLKLPAGVHDYYAYEAAGIQHTMLQVRFELPLAKLPQFSACLPCRLGAVESGPPEHGVVASNERAWYTPEDAAKHRGCDYQKDLTTASILVDLSGADVARVYAVISRE